MKVIKFIAISIVVVLVVSVIGVFVFLKSFDLNKYLPVITKAASESMKKDVRIERADATLSFNGAVIDVKNITIADPGKFPLIQIASLRIVPDLDAVFSKKKAIATIYLASGSIGVDAGSLDAIKNGLIDSHIIIKDIKIEELLAPDAIPLHIKGRILGNMDILANKADIKGKGELSVEGGVIEQLNILKATLGSVLGGVPGLAETADAVLMDTLKTRIGGDNTILEKVQVKFTIEDNTIFIDDALATTSAFEVNAKGTVGFNMKTNVHVTTFVASDVSAQLVGKLDQLSTLMDDSKRLKVEGDLTGTIPDVKFTPSIKVKDIVKATAISEGMKQLDKAIEKHPELEPAKELINSVLGNIFK